MGVTAVGGGVGQAVLRALAAGSIPVRTVAFHTRPLAAGRFWADAAHTVPLARDESDYLARLDLLHVADLAIAVRLSLSTSLPSAPPFTLNIGGGAVGTVADMAACCVEAARGLGLEGPEIVADHGSAARPGDFVVDDRRARAWLGWAPVVDRPRAFADLVQMAVSDVPEEDG